MTRKELNLAVFEGTAKTVLWQPRLETWIGHHMSRGTMPERFRGMDSFGIYDALRCSVRYAACAGIEGYQTRDDLVHIDEHHPQNTIHRVRTPLGEIRTVYRDIWEDGRMVNHRIEDYPVKTVADLRVATDLIDRQQFRANVESHRRAAETVGRRLKQLAASCQVLCVTHLPQIAGFADHHFFVEKQEAGGRTVAVIQELEGEARTREIGRMLSGERLTREALKHAEQLLKTGAQ